MILCLREKYDVALICLIDFRCFVAEGSLVRFVLIINWWR